MLLVTVPQQTKTEYCVFRIYGPTTAITINKDCFMGLFDSRKFMEEEVKKRTDRNVSAKRY